MARHFFGRLPADDQGAKNICEMTKGVLTIAIGASLAFQRGCASARAPWGNVDVKSLPMSVQQTINQQASGGEIVEVKRENEPDGRWNYEVVVKTSGKDCKLFRPGCLKARLGI